MSLAEKPLAELVQELPLVIQLEVRDFIEFLLKKQKRTAIDREWPSNYFTDVVGSLPSFPDADDRANGIDFGRDESDEALRF